MEDKKFIIEQFSYAKEFKGIIGQEIPKSWMKIREKLKGLSQNQYWISYSEYLKLCRNEGLPPNHADDLCLFLHQIANVFYFPQSTSLQDIIFIDLLKVVNIIYKLLDEDTLRARGGKFNLKYIQKILKDFSENEQVYLTELILCFEVCFLLDEKKEVYVAPQFLSKERPNEFLMIWDEEIRPSLIFQYQYFLHPSIMVRFLSQFGRYVKEKCYWKNGVLIKKYKTIALIEANEKQESVIISIKGDRQSGLLKEVQQSLLKISDLIEFKILIPCNCEDCQKDSNPYLYKIEDLEERLGKLKVKVECPKSYQDASVFSMLEGLPKGEFYIEGEDQQWLIMK